MQLSVTIHSPYGHRTIDFCFWIGSFLRHGHAEVSGPRNTLKQVGPATASGRSTEVLSQLEASWQVCKKKNIYILKKWMSDIKHILKEDAFITKTKTNPIVCYYLILLGRVAQSRMKKIIFSIKQSHVHVCVCVCVYYTDYNLYR